VHVDVRTHALRECAGVASLEEQVIKAGLERSKFELGSFEF